jgi:hypothetical protein
MLRPIFRLQRFALRVSGWLVGIPTQQQKDADPESVDGNEGETFYLDGKKFYFYTFPEGEPNTGRRILMECNVDPLLSSEDEE